MSEAARKLAGLSAKEGAEKVKEKAERTYVPHRGTVASVDENTAYVVLDGSEGQTPCSMTMKCKTGDRVVVHIFDHQARVTGNLTAPATDDEVANEALGKAEDAEGAAAEAQAVAEALGQHFWEDPSGVHVTQATQESFAQNPTGPNMLANSQGILLRDGASNLSQLTPGTVAFYDGQGNASANIIASFGAIGAQVGKATSMHATVDSAGLKVYDGSDNLVSYFTASSARMGNASGDYAVVNENGIYFYKDSVLIGYCLGDSARLGAIAEGTKNVIANTSGIYLRENTTNLASFTPSAATVGKVASGSKNLYATANGIYLRDNTTNLASFTSDAVTIGNTASGNKNLYATASGLYMRDGTADIASFEPDSIRLGGSNSAQISLLTRGLIKYDSDYQIDDAHSTVIPSLVLSGDAQDDQGAKRRSGIIVRSSMGSNYGAHIVVADRREGASMEYPSGYINLGVWSGPTGFWQGLSIDGDQTYFGGHSFGFRIPAAFKAGLGLGTAEQNFGITASNGADQVFSINAKCVNANNTAQNGDRFLLIPRNNGLGLYNATDSAWMWNLSSLTPAVTSTVSSIISQTGTDGIIINEAQRVIFGKICQVYVSWKFQGPITVGPNGDITDITIGTLTSSARPAIYCAGTSNGNLGGTGTFYNVSTDGTVKLTACNGTGAQRTIAAGTTFYFYTTFIMP